MKSQCCQYRAAFLQASQASAHSHNMQIAVCGNSLTRMEEQQARRAKGAMLTTAEEEEEEMLEASFETSLSFCLLASSVCTF